MFYKSIMDPYWSKCICSVFLKALQGYSNIFCSFRNKQKYSIIWKREKNLEKSKTKKRERDKIKIKTPTLLQTFCQARGNANNKGDYFAFSKVSATFMATEMLTNAAVELHREEKHVEMPDDQPVCGENED